VISYTASANVIGSNPSVDILVDGVVVDNGAFTPPTYQFSGIVPAPAGASAGDTVTVSLLVIGTWTNGVDTAEGGQTAEVEVTLPAVPCETGTGRFTGGGHQLTAGGVKITRGLTIHCDLLLSNNLEINWEGNQFHMTEHLTTLACTDDPDIDQTPPKAPLDTLTGIGTGRYNGDAGYTIEFTLVDAGEPGREDQMSMLIYETADPSNVVLNVPLQFLTGGNLQAHYDQPHKNKNK